MLEGQGFLQGWDEPMAHKRSSVNASLNLEVWLGDPAPHHDECEQWPDSVSVPLP